MVLVAVHTGRTPQAVPLANAFLQAYLATAPDLPVEAARADFYLGDPPEFCVATILKERPDAVAFSLYLWNRELCRAIARQLRLAAPGIRLIAGGPEATAAPGSVLADGYDFLISGDGELPFAEACRQLTSGGELSAIPGIATQSGNGYTLIPADPLLMLDEIPSPWLNGILDARAYPGILWQLSRGCGFTCDFCFDSRDRHGVRRFSLERIEAELRYFTASGVSQVFVLDSTFNQDRERAKAILRLIRRIATQIHFHFEVRSEFIDSEMAELFAATTCSLQIGLQSANPAVLKQVGRTFRPDEFVSRTMLLNSTGAVFGFDLIYGLPGDTLEGFRHSIDFALQLYPNHLDIFPLAILPGTALADRSDKLGLKYLPAPPYTLLETPDFTAAEMNSARRLATACDIFYTRGRAVAWFNGVCDLLRQRPVELLERFAAWLESEGLAPADESELTDEAIWELQRRFLEQCCDSKRQRRFLPAVLDLINYHYHYAAALLSPPAAAPTQRLSVQQLLLSPLRMAASTRLASFHYDILEILDCGAADAHLICTTLRPSPSWAAIYPAEDGIRTESLDTAYIRLLKELDGVRPVRDAASRAGVTPKDATEFLVFALEEGLVTF